MQPTEHYPESLFPAPNEQLVYRALESMDHVRARYKAELAAAPRRHREELAAEWIRNIDLVPPSSGHPTNEDTEILRTQIVAAYGFAENGNPDYHLSVAEEEEDREDVDSRLNLLSVINNARDPDHRYAELYGKEVVSLVWNVGYRDNKDFDAQKAREQEAAELLRQQAEQKDKAEHDILTGLYNRIGWTVRVNEMARDRKPMAVLIIDLDGFKILNDTLGHGEGDRVLAAFADILQRHTRAGDVVTRLDRGTLDVSYKGMEGLVAARLGGDEFAVALSTEPGNDVELAKSQELVPREGPRAGKFERVQDDLTAEDRVNRYLERIGKEFSAWLALPENAHLAEHGLNIGMTAGEALWDGSGEFDLSALMKGADASMYINKEIKKGGIIMELPLQERVYLDIARRILRKLGIRIPGLPRDLILPGELGEDEVPAAEQPLEERAFLGSVWSAIRRFRIGRRS